MEYKTENKYHKIYFTVLRWHGRGRDHIHLEAEGVLLKGIRTGVL